MKKRFLALIFAFIMLSSLCCMTACSKNETKISLNKVSIYMGETNESLTKFNSVDRAYDYFNESKTNTYYQKAVYWAENAKLTINTEDFILHDEYRGVNYLLANTWDYYLKDNYQQAWTLHVFWGNTYVREDYALVEKTKNGNWRLVYECDIYGYIVKVIVQS